MKSPITGKEMLISKENRTLTFRKEAFPIVYHFYTCQDSGEQFTSTLLDELNMQQVYNHYLDKHNLPFPEEIKEIRERYGLPASKMSEILGFGINSYRNYENGEVPNLSNGKLIQLIKDPKKFKDLVEMSEALKDKAKEKLIKKLDHIIEQTDEKFSDFELEDYLFSKSSRLPNEFTGYKKPDLKKLTEMVVFFSEQLIPWKTQLNKLMFYADFLMFKRNCFSMSGLTYRAINMGPVPNNYNSIYEYIANNAHIEIILHDFGGEAFHPKEGRSFNPDVFSKNELTVLQHVANTFKKVATSKVSTKPIIAISHKEPAWIANEKDKNLISYRYAFELSEV